MDIQDCLRFGFRTSDEKFDFGIVFHRVNRTDDCSQLGEASTAEPDVDFLPIPCGGSAQVPVVEGIEEIGIFWVGTPFRTVNHNVMHLQERMQLLPKADIGHGEGSYDEGKCFAVIFPKQKKEEAEFKSASFVSASTSSLAGA